MTWRPSLDQLPPDLRGWAWGLWYQYVNRLLGERPVQFLNFGYVPAHSPKTVVPFLEGDEAHRLSVQLYQRVLLGMDLKGQQVLEVSCGRGGGSWYVARYGRPSRLVGTDRSPSAIRFCATAHVRSNLEFRVADAEKLPFPDETFDAVLNVEASHAYPRGRRFLSEARRVLRPGGVVLLADFRPRPKLRMWEAEFAGAGLVIEAREDISSGVLASLVRSAELRLQLIQQLAPRWPRSVFLNFAGARGSRVFRGLADGELAYLRYRLRKPTGGAPVQAGFS